MTIAAHHEQGARVDVEFAIGEEETEWRPATVAGVRSSHANDDEQRTPYRVDVVMQNGARINACHPRCVRPAD